MSYGSKRTGKALIQEIEETEVPFGCLAVWFLGQASVILKGGGITVYIDPYVTENPDRSFPPLLAAEEIGGAQLVLITHEHLDHLDEEAIPVISANNPEAAFIAPGFCRERLLELGVRAERLTTAYQGREIDPLPVKDTGNPTEGAKASVIVVPVPAAHEQLEYHTDGSARYVGYIVKLNGVTFYHSGDTVLFPELMETVKAQSVDLGMLPINGRDYFRTGMDIVGNMDYREAAGFAAEAGMDTVVPLHYDLFAANAENPGYFTDYLYRHFPLQKHHVMARGERFVYVAPAAFRAGSGQQ